MTGSATGADARRERGKMPTAASDQVSNDAAATVPPPRFVVYHGLGSILRESPKFIERAVILSKGEKPCPEDFPAEVFWVAAR